MSPSHQTDVFQDFKPASLVDQNETTRSSLSQLMMSLKDNPSVKTLSSKKSILPLKQLLYANKNSPQTVTTRANSSLQSPHKQCFETQPTPNLFKDKLIQ